MDTSQPSPADVKIRGTVRGIALVIGAIGLIITSVLTDAPTFAVIGIGLVIAAIVSLLELRLSAYQLRRHSSELVHGLSSVRPTAGDDVTLTTSMPKGLWVTSAQGLRWQHCPPLSAGHIMLSTTSSESDGSFNVSTDIRELRRGRWHLGQLVGFRDDLLGLAHLVARVEIDDLLTVWPTTHPATPPGTGLDSAEITNSGKPVLQAHDDSTLREYNIGDDLRRVHWPSSARHGDLLVKNADSSDQGQLSVILHVAGLDGEVSHWATEAAVTLAASVLRSANEGGMPARLAIPGVIKRTQLVGELDLRAQLDQLSSVQPVPHRPELLVALAHDLAAIGHNDHCVLIVAGSLPDGAAQTLRSFAAGAQSSAAIVVTEDGQTDTHSVRELSAASWRIIPADARRPRLELERLGAAWRS